MRMTPVAPNPYDVALDKNAANFAPLTPLTFFAWSAHVCPQRVAVSMVRAASRGATPTHGVAASPRRWPAAASAPATP